MEPESYNAEAAPVPLCVDLDGTLIRSDLLLESLFGLLKRNLLYLLLLPFWLLRGKAAFKGRIAARVELAVDLLPYNEPLLAWLREQRAAGRPLLLATASNVRYAEHVALHLGLFEGVLASDGETNLSGRRKGQRLVERYGERGFDYAGNSAVDLLVWSHARGAILVNAPASVAQRAGRLTRIERRFEDPPPTLREYLKALRLHQWLKNLLLFVPLAMAHQALAPQLLGQALLGFLAFGLCASSVYLLNDLLDLPADRGHPSKRKRPFAAGRIPLHHGVVLIPLLLFAALLGALWLPWPFLGALGLYYAVTLAYSLRLKQAALVDVLTLAGLYTMRLVAGGAAAGVALSFWLLAFSMFLFLSLALVKRYSELLVMQQDNRDNAQGRGYQVGDLEGLAQFGAASGYLAVLVLALYINSEQVKALYARPEAIWLLCPLLLYWISRVWLLARRDQMHEDPVVFAIEDRRSHWLVIIGAAILWVAV
jgi:4-hydroxybenzoate polyprenyltransferase/phosphoserine phosphatase